MKNCIEALIVFASSVVSSHPANAQRATKLAKIGYLNVAGSPAVNVEAFQQGLRDLGYVDGKNIAVEYRTGDSFARLAELAKELVQQKVTSSS